MFVLLDKIFVRDEDSMKMKITFRKYNGARSVHRIPFPEPLDAEKLVRILRQKGVSIDDGVGFLKVLRSKYRRVALKTPTTFVPSVGWYGDDGFVMPEESFGSAEGMTQYDREKHPVIDGLGQAEGSLECWKAKVAKPAESSSYLMFAILVAFAAPLFRHSGQTESAVFNFFGESASGKTTALRVASTVIGACSSLPTWNTTHRALEELAAKHNDLMLPLDDIEGMRGSAREVYQFVRDAAHYLVAGQARALSSVVSDAGLGSLDWRCTVLSSGPKPLRALAAGVGAEGSQGDHVRFIDIPVPSRAEGGILDNLDRGVDRGPSADRRMTDLAEACAECYGVALSEWLEYLVIEENRDPVAGLVEEFVESCCEGEDPYMLRLSRKFGLVYAAGVLAVKADLLPWKEKYVRMAVEKCFDLAVSEVRRKEIRFRVDANSLLRVAKDGNKFPRFGSNHSGAYQLGKEGEGFIRSLKGKRQLVVSGVGLEKTLDIQDGDVDGFLEGAEKAGALLHGDGGKRTKQFRTIDENGKELKKRYYVFSQQMLKDIGSSA